MLITIPVKLMPSGRCGCVGKDGHDAGHKREILLGVGALFPSTLAPYAWTNAHSCPGWYRLPVRRNRPPGGGRWATVSRAWPAELRADPARRRHLAAGGPFTGSGSLRRGRTAGLGCRHRGGPGPGAGEKRAGRPGRPDAALDLRFQPAPYTRTTRSLVLRRTPSCCRPSPKAGTPRRKPTAHPRPPSRRPPWQLRKAVPTCAGPA